MIQQKGVTLTIGTQLIFDQEKIELKLSLAHKRQVIADFRLGINTAVISNIVSSLLFKYSNDYCPKTGGCLACNNIVKVGQL